MNNKHTHKPNEYCVIGLDNPKDKNNIGSILRACYCFDVSMLAIGGSRIKKSVLNTMSTEKKFLFSMI